ncbi:hypothetical protein HLV39_02755 [Marinobacter adhaerens]|uniref:asparagine synthase (glutamine-hydrolyzing) n=1 Tax=Marinobacter adhaerens TaxID=1033846 RepID=A0A851HKP0_9GAMM|nr:hypothetical protein [Marinobacter adhaerens]NWN90419.1 hypothetical protein [Marinobacter adhaerens]
MLILGNHQGSHFSAAFSNGNLVFEGPKSHFHGYKIDSGIPGDGVYVEWSATDHTVTISTDRLGMLPYYIFHRPNRLMVSDTIHKILNSVPEHDFQLDYAALSVQFRLGHFLGDDTAFTDIKRLPANAIIKLTEHGLETTFRSEPPNPMLDISAEKAVKVYGERFDELMENLLHNNHAPLIIPASGGRDSRHILLALDRLKIQPKICITQRHLPPTPDDDYICAKTLCKSLGFNHKILNKTADILDDEINKNRLINYESEPHGWIMPTIEYLAEQSDNIILDGLGGDRLSESKLDKVLYDLYKQERFSDLSRLMLGRGDYLQTFLTQPLRRHLNYEIAIDAISKKLEEYKGLNNPIIEFYLRNRTRRCIAPSCWNLFGYSNHVITPFIAADLHRLLVSFPAEIHEAQNLHTRTIADRYPQYSQLPYAGDKIANLPNMKEHVSNIFTGLKALKLHSSRPPVTELLPELTRLMSAARSRKDLTRFIALQNRFTLLQQTTRSVKTET